MTGTLMTAIDSVAQSVVLRWRTLGHPATVVPWEEVDVGGGHFECGDRAIVEAVVVPSTNVIECVVSESADWSLVLAQVRGVIDLGWTVVVLAPLPEMGAAHEGLRGSSARLQGWWLRTGDDMHFSRMEIA